MSIPLKTLTIPDIDNTYTVIDQDSVAPAYSAAATYAAGDYCIYEGKLYKCTTAITTAEAWTAAHWTAADIAGEVQSMAAGQEIWQKLLCNEIPNTTQAYTFTDGAVSSVTHSANGAAIRTDTFTYTAGAITEIRTLASGESLTIITNLETLETTVTYTAA